MPPDLAALVTARDEGERIGATVAALGAAVPSARVLVADDASSDDTALRASRAGAEVVRAPRRLGKGGAANLGARALLGEHGRPPTLLLCDGDLGASAARLGALLEALERDEGDLAVAAFARRRGGGLGFALGASRLAVRDLTGLEARAPMSGQRALRPEVVRAVLPFAPGFGMEVGMTADAHRGGFRLVEVTLELHHRPTGRDLAGWAHRGRQLADVGRAWAHRRAAPRMGSPDRG